MEKEGGSLPCLVNIKVHVNENTSARRRLVLFRN
jgi:hypothetical protein